jgi:hypothetical protein
VLFNPIFLTADKNISYSAADEFLSEADEFLSEANKTQ